MLWIKVGTSHITLTEKSSIHCVLSITPTRPDDPDSANPWVSTSKTSWDQSVVEGANQHGPHDGVIIISSFARTRGNLAVSSLLLALDIHAPLDVPMSP